ncbi:peptidase inhibitor family I36 protein [Streptosporangium canum]|uniref:peptidase inhibitor family I36 protein n=1 Tax=Streptosporangium canum TaxID=324952 RepID=UPI0036A354E7
MKKTRSVMAALALTTLALLNGVGTAQADPVDSPSSSAAAVPDGYLYAWEHAGFTGAWCRWAGDDSNWSTCQGAGPVINLRNKASSLKNRGYTGAYEDVDLYWDNADDEGGWDGTRICMRNGLELDNLTGIYYPYDGRSGQGESLNDNISAHRWSSNC